MSSRWVLIIFSKSWNSIRTHDKKHRTPKTVTNPHQYCQLTWPPKSPPIYVNWHFKHIFEGNVRGDIVPVRDDDDSADKLGYTRWSCWWYRVLSESRSGQTSGWAGQCWELNSHFNKFNLFTRVFQKQTELAIMAILTSEALLRGNNKSSSEMVPQRVLNLALQPFRSNALLSELSRHASTVQRGEHQTWTAEVSGSMLTGITFLLLEFFFYFYMVKPLIPTLPLFDTVIVWIILIFYCFRCGPMLQHRSFSLSQPVLGVSLPWQVTINSITTCTGKYMTLHGLCIFLFGLFSIHADINLGNYELSSVCCCCCCCCRCLLTPFPIGYFQIQNDI